ncbi:MAG: methyl-accepting chemotaxis protein [Mariprofundus sp.]|nr:methyl-accepting chemotaxis protein [Mariprofundus sp.]
MMLFGKSAEKKLMTELMTVMQAVSKGDLSTQISSDGKSGDCLAVAEVVNQMINQMGQAMSDTAQGLKALEDGDVSFRVERTYEGVFDDIIQSMNGITAKLDSTLNDAVVPVVQAAVAGDLTARIDISCYDGFYQRLGHEINTLVGSIEEVIGETVSGLKALEQGDLSFAITSEYQGTFDDIKRALNTITKKLTDTLETDITPVVTCMMNGDLTNRIDTSKYEGFYADLGNIVNDLADNTTTVIKGIAEASLEVGNASKEIVQGNAQLNEATQAQAASLEETAASIEEITGTIQQTAENSRRASQLSVEAREQAEKGNGVVKQATEAMAEIHQSSSKISDIIGVIDEIAFQTNLLALNAAVEAARAGEQGRGFAVVAGEVRALAQRSAEAAKEIKALITASVENVANGRSLVDQSGQALVEIVESIHKVTGIVGEIAVAGDEQASGVEQINIAVAQLDSGTQQNAAMVEEVNAVSEGLDGQVRDLNALVDGFKLEDEHAKKAHVVQPKKPASAAIKTTGKAVKSKPESNKTKKKKVLETHDGDDVWEEF